MDDDNGSALSSITAIPQRVAALIELLTSLDQRVIATLDGLDDIHRTVTGFDELSARADAVAGDLEKRIAAMDERLNRDLDDLKELLIAKIGEVDVKDVGTRLDRIEQAMLNIERATVRLDQTVEGGLEAMPDFVTKRVKKEARKKVPPPETRH
jgi:vacuolar-type H+-ATPase subunit I/STV1